MKVRWVTDYDLDGNRLGFSVHNRKAREAFAEAGGVLDESAPVAVHVASPASWRPLKGRTNVLYTAWESPELPAALAAGAARADAIVVPARFLVEVFERATGRPVWCCPLGVDAEVFRYATHPRRPGGRFRFLWVGAPNARKGWPCVAEAWEALTRAHSHGDIDFDCELYVKTTVTEKLADLGNGVTWDSRRLPERELARLYAEAHCFLFPTMGEGFGLTLAEAMAAGLPCIYTPWTAAGELMAPGCGWPLSYRTERIGLDGGLGEAVFARADSGDLAAKMLRVLRSPREAALRGRRAARRVREQFTWQRTGSALLGILEEISCLQAAS